MKLGPGQIGATIAIAAAITIHNRGGWNAFTTSFNQSLAERPAEDHLIPLAGVALFLYLIYLAWSLGGRRPARLDAPGGEDTRQSFAFRLGKALNRVLHRRVRPTVLDDPR